MSKRAHRKSSFKKREPKEFAEEVIQIDRVTRVVKGGRKLRFRATVAIGNHKGKVGVGTGKSHEVTGAIKKAIAKAKKSIIEVPIDGTTIPHDIKVKIKSSRILLLPASPGTGIIAGGPIRKVLELAGYKNILSKSYGTTNKLNNTKATYTALGMLKETPFMLMRKKEMAKEKALRAEQQKAKKASPKKVEKKTVAKKDSTKKASPKTTKKETSKKPADKAVKKETVKKDSKKKDTTKTEKSN